MATVSHPVSPLSPRWDPARYQPILAAPHHIGIAVLMLYVFVMVTRAPEILAIHFRSSFSVVAISTGLAALCVLAGGYWRGLFVTRLTYFFVLLHGWFAFTIPFSAWRYGSFQTLKVISQYALLFVFIPLLVRTERHLRLAAWAICGSTLSVLVYTSIFAKFQDEDYERISTTIGRFGNANDLAFFLMMGIPFWMYIAVSTRYPAFIRILASIEIAASILQCFRTGSRGALLTLVLVGILLFVTASVGNKVRLAVLAMTVAFLAVTLVPASVQNRLASILDSSRDFSAAQSSAGRMALLMESIDITLRNPAVGVGLGVYVDAVLGMSRAEGQQKSFQQVPHNTFTTISAETGLPGLLLYLGCLFYAWQSAWRARRIAARIPGMDDFLLFCNCVTLVLIIFTWNNLFFSLTGDLLFYLTCGMCVATYSVALERQATHQKATAAPAAAPNPASPQEAPAAEAPASTPLPWLDPTATNGPRQSHFGGAAARASKPPKQQQQPAAAGSSSDNPYGDAPWARSPRRRS